MEAAAVDHPADLGRRSWWAILKRTVKEFQDDNLTDWAAALTYYGVMSLFPMLVALVAVLGLFGSADSVTKMIGSLNEAGLGRIARALNEPLGDVVRNRSGAGILFVLGLAIALVVGVGLHRRLHP